MGQPAQLTDLGIGTDGGATGHVEGGAAEQRLPPDGQGHEPRRERLRQPLDLYNVGTASNVLVGVTPDDDFAQVDTDSTLEGDPQVLGKLVERQVIARPSLTASIGR